MLDEAIALTPFVTFSYGETGNWDYKAITFGLGVTFPSSLQIPSHSPKLKLFGRKTYRVTGLEISEVLT